MVVSAPVKVSDTGKIEKMEVHSDGVVVNKGVDIKSENITVDKDAVAIVGDKEQTGSGSALPADTPSSSGNSSGGSSGNDSGAAYAISIKTNSVQANGLTATGTVSPSGNQTLGTAVTVTVTLTGTATEAGTHTWG